MGMKLAYEPELVKLPEGTTIKSIGAGNKCFSMVSEDN